jgi:NAD(P)-dependent dehydrogenase (short-subunit alcohol dehydrogenase family)
VAGILADKIAVVTGAGRGIGRAIAVELAAAGAKVVVASRTRTTVEEAVHAIESEGGEAIGAVCDVSRRADVTRALSVTRVCGVSVWRRPFLREVSPKAAGNRRCTEH